MKPLWQLLVIAIVLTLSVQRVFADQVLVRYGFDGALPSANDGFYIFENSRGFVQPSSEVRFSGYRALEIQEAPMNDGFVELQGVIQPVTKGELLFHFAFLVKNPQEELNIAVCGPEHFFMRKDGMLFWLKTLDGMLYHHSDSIPKKLFKLEADTWYVADVAIHLGQGTYDLRIVRSGANKPEAILVNQPNAINQANAKLMKISFIGDLDDRSSVHYFVDDVELRQLDSPIDLTQFSPADGAPQNVVSVNSQSTANSDDEDRKHIDHAQPSSALRGELDEYLELKKLELTRLQCLPATGIKDFGVTREDLSSDSTLKTELKRATSIDLSSLPSPDSFSRPTARSVVLWRKGCLFLSSGDFKSAARELSESVRLQHEAPIYHAALALLASAKKDKWSSEKELLSLYTPWADDARLPVLLGLIASAWNDHKKVAEALSGLATRMSDETSLRQISKYLVGDSSGFDDLKSAFGENWKRELDDLYIGQSYYFALLFGSKAVEAAEFAAKLEQKYAALPQAAFTWKERRADAEFLAGNQCKAKIAYKEIASSCANCKTVKKKFADLITLPSCE